jgi:transcriptional regulator with XRE-family HTH domain
VGPHRAAGRRDPTDTLRKALHLAQEQVAEEFGVGQAAISRFERRPDMCLSSLRRFVEALGGELEVRARFPGGDVVLDQIGDLEDDGAGEGHEVEGVPTPTRSGG